MTPMPLLNKYFNYDGAKILNLKQTSKQYILYFGPLTYVRDTIFSQITVIDVRRPEEVVEVNRHDFVSSSEL